MFLIFNLFVFRVPETVKYSQLRIPKKNAPHASCSIASSNGVNLFRYMDWKTHRGKAFCCFFDGSASMNSVIFLVRNRDGLLSASRDGFCRRFVRKVWRTCVTVDLTVFPRSIVLLVVPNLFRRQLLANADNKCVRCSLLNFSIHGSVIPIPSRNRFQRSKLPTCFCWVEAAISSFWSRMDSMSVASRQCLVEERISWNSSASGWGEGNEMLRWVLY